MKNDEKQSKQHQKILTIQNFHFFLNQIMSNGYNIVPLRFCTTNYNFDLEIL